MQENELEIDFSEDDASFFVRLFICFTFGFFLQVFLASQLILNQNLFLLQLSYVYFSNPLLSAVGKLPYQKQEFTARSWFLEEKQKGVSHAHWVLSLMRRDVLFICEGRIDFFLIAISCCFKWKIHVRLVCDKLLNYSEMIGVRENNLQNC